MTMSFGVRGVKYHQYKKAMSVCAIFVPTTTLFLGMAISRHGGRRTICVVLMSMNVFMHISTSYICVCPFSVTEEIAFPNLR